MSLSEPTTFSARQSWGIVSLLGLAALAWLVFAIWPEWLNDILISKKAFVSAILNGLTLAGLYFLVASGFTLIFGLMRNVNLAHGSLYLLGAYIGYEVASRTGYWLLGVTASESTYHQSVAGINQTYLYSGESQNSEIRLSRLIYRDAVRKTTLSLRGWTRASRNYVEDIEIGNQRRRTSGWETGLGHREFIGIATLDASFAYRRGTGAANALSAP